MEEANERRVYVKKEVATDCCEDSGMNNFQNNDQKDPMETDDAQKLADEIREMILKKREERNRMKIENIEGEDRMNTCTGMEENNPQHRFKQEPKLSADSELLKRQVGAWRVVLQRLPITAGVNPERVDETETGDVTSHPAQESITEGEDNEIKYFTGMEENNPQHTFKQEPKLSADSELLKRQVGAWRVVLQRLPITAGMEPERVDQTDTGDVTSHPAQESITEGEDNEIKYFTDMEENNAQHMFKQEPKLSADSELLKRQVGAWRVVLQRLPITAGVKLERVDQTETGDVTSQPAQESITEEEDNDIKYVNEQDFLDIGETVVSKRDIAEPGTSSTGYQTPQKGHQEEKKIPQLTGKNKFICDYCHRQYRFRSNLIIHLKTHGPKMYKCHACNYQSKRKKSLNIHRTTHPDEELYTFEVSDNRSFKKRTLTCHTIKKHPKQKWYQCAECKYGCNSKSNLIKHFVKHTTDRPFKCEECDYRSKHPLTLKKHRLRHTGEKPYACEICDYRCLYRISYKNHILNHSEKTVKCKECDFQCNHADKLKKHMRRHTGEKPYKCEICDCRYSYLNSLRTHSVTHSNEKPFKCEFCDYQSTQKGHLTIHLRTHTRVKPYKCKFCDYRCIETGNLKIHMRIHTAEKPHKCDFCDYRSNQSSHLKSHVKIHTGEKPHKCNLCDYRGRNASALTSHLRIHTGEKPFQCDICNHQCSQKGSLKMHMKTHTKEKLYKCHLCEYHCVNNSALKIHMSIHSGEKTYKCDDCDYLFKYYSTLKKHIMTHSKKKLRKTVL